MPLRERLFFAALLMVAACIFALPLLVQFWGQNVKVEGEDEFCGLIDRTGKPIAVIRNHDDKFGELHEGRIRLYSPYACSYFDDKGTLVVGNLRASGDFKGGRAVAQDHLQNWGFLGLDGKWLIEPTFESIGNFSEGLAAVKNKDQRWQYIDPDQRIIIAPRFAYACRFADGLAAATDDAKKWGYIDKQGKWRIEQQYSEESDFCGGTAVVTLETPSENGATNTLKVIDTTGRVLLSYAVPLDMRDLTRKAMQGTLADWHDDDPLSYYNLVDGLAVRVQNERFGLTDVTGKWVVPADYKALRRVGKDLYVAKKDENHVGVINGSGCTVVPFDYRAIGDFDGVSGLAKALDREDRSIYITSNGWVAIKNKIHWENVGNFSEGYAAVQSFEKPVVGP